MDFFGKETDKLVLCVSKAAIEQAGRIWDSVVPGAPTLFAFLWDRNGAALVQNVDLRPTS